MNDYLFLYNFVEVQELQDRVGRVANVDSNEELMEIGREIVDFHGEMILLENYSALNYTGTCLLFLSQNKCLHELISNLM